MRYLLIALSMLLWQAAPAHADVRVGVNIGINVPAYPDLVPIPGYPVYYDPYASSNYFFYDGLYWVYLDDNWYSSSWYDGPWILTEPVYVPVFVLRVPVRYYRRPPVYFSGWIVDAPPRWDQHWGPAWESRRRGWDHWDRRYAPRPAPLPVYQRQYAGNRYPHQIEQQRVIRNEKYHYQPREGLSQRDEREDQQQSRLRTYPQEQAAKPQPEYYRGGQSNRNEAQDGTPERRPPGNTATPQPQQGQDARAVSQMPNSQHNRFESDRMRDSRMAPRNEAGAGSQIPSSQNNKFESGRRGDPASRANERNIGASTPIPTTAGNPIPTQNNRFQSDAPGNRPGPQGRGGDRGGDRGAGQGRGSDSRGGGYGQDRR